MCVKNLDSSEIRLCLKYRYCELFSGNWKNISRKEGKVINCANYTGTKLRLTA